MIWLRDLAFTIDPHNFIFQQFRKVVREKKVDIEETIKENASEIGADLPNMYLLDITPNPRLGKKTGNVKSSIKKVLKALPNMKIENIQ